MSGPLPLLHPVYINRNKTKYIVHPVGPYHTLLLFSINFLEIMMQPKMYSYTLLKYIS
jgi:hypothetical protein